MGTDYYTKLIYGINLGNTEEEMKNSPWIQDGYGEEGQWKWEKEILPKEFPLLRLETSGYEGFSYFEYVLGHIVLERDDWENQPYVPAIGIEPKILDELKRFQEKYKLEHLLPGFLLTCYVG